MEKFISFETDGIYSSRDILIDNSNDNFVLIDDLKNLFNEVFMHNISFDSFYNKHFLNPNRINNYFYFYVINGSIVAMNGFMGMVFKNKNDTFLISQSCDTAVSSVCRGKGIFTKLVQEFEANDNDTLFTIGIPNENSTHGFLKMGFEKKVDLATMIKLRLFSFCKFRLKKYEKIVATDKADFSTVELNNINSSFEVGFMRSNDYINYKLKNLNSNAKVLKLYSGSTLEGYIIVHLLKKIGFINIYSIDDWYVCDYSNIKRVFSLILNSFSYFPCFFKISMVNVNYDYNILKKVGFRDYTKKSKREYEKVVVSKRGDKLNLDWNSLNLKFIDSDTILNY